jgi:hypothetical protein
MEGIFENIQILIPLALFIAFRVIRAKNKQTNQQQKKTSEERRDELIKKIKEAQRIPEYRKALTEDTEIYIPPKPSQKPKTAAKPAPVRPAAKRAEEKKINRPTAEVKTQEKLFTEIKTQIDQTPAAPHSLKTGFSLHSLTPLQQAVVWSEILGQPKGECIS